MGAIQHEHKKELHERITERYNQLEASLIELQRDQQSAKSGRARGIEDALAELEIHLSGGWESIDEPEAASLARWLEATRFLFDQKAAPKPAPIVDDEMQTCVEEPEVIHAVRREVVPDAVQAGPEKHDGPLE